MTIGELLKGLPTIQQYDILMRADRIFPVGRYYGGQLLDVELEYLKGPNVLSRPQSTH